MASGGNASGVFGPVSGDVVFDGNSFAYSGDDAFMMNFPIIQYEPNQVSPSTLPIPPQTPVVAFNPSMPNQFEWPVGYVASPGDTYLIYDNLLNFIGAKTITEVSANANGSLLTLDSAVDPASIKNGFIGADLTQYGGARYVLSGNSFNYTAGRAILAQTPFGLIENNSFVGQSSRQIYMHASLYWGFGGSAQEVTVTGNTFDARGHGGDFLALDFAVEPANAEFTEIIGTGPSSSPANQNIIVANNQFISDTPTAVVNVSLANNILFTGNSFTIQPLSGSQDTKSASVLGPGQLPISIHDASNIQFDGSNSIAPSWLSGGSCTDSRMLPLSMPAPEVVPQSAIACVVPQTTVGFESTYSQ
jgi:hypothetical protein